MSKKRKRNGGALTSEIMNSALIKFLDNGQVECVSWNSLRKNKKAVGELFL